MLLKGKMFFVNGKKSQMRKRLGFLTFYLSFFIMLMGKCNPLPGSIRKEGSPQGRLQSRTSGRNPRLQKLPVSAKAATSGGAGCSVRRRPGESCGHAGRADCRYPKDSGRLNQRAEPVFGSALFCKYNRVKTDAALTRIAPFRPKARFAELLSARCIPGDRLALFSGDC